MVEKERTTTQRKRPVHKSRQVGGKIPDRFVFNDKFKYHWGADDEIMKIINRRDNSPETQELVERRIELTRPGHMRHHWHKKLEREILLPRRPDDVDRKEIKRIDIRLRRKEENQLHISGRLLQKLWR